MFIELQATQKVLSTALGLSAESLSAGEIVGGAGWRSQLQSTSASQLNPSSGSFYGPRVPVSERALTVLTILGRPGGCSLSPTLPLNCV